MSEAQKGIKKRWVILIGTIVVILLFAIGGDNSPESVKTSQNQITDQKAYVMSQSYVKATLKSPSTAKFSSSDFSFANLGNNKYKITSYVDAQNSFGAEIRTPYTATLSYKGGEWADSSNWVLNELIVDGSVIYSE